MSEDPYSFCDKVYDLRPEDGTFISKYAVIDDTGYVQPSKDDLRKTAEEAKREREGVIKKIRGLILKTVANGASAAEAERPRFASRPAFSPSWAARASRDWPSSDGKLLLRVDGPHSSAIESEPAPWDEASAARRPPRSSGPLSSQPSFTTIDGSLAIRGSRESSRHSQTVLSGLRERQELSRLSVRIASAKEAP